jgi:acetolactate synthase-1/2/3 large subunit
VPAWRSTPSVVEPDADLVREAAVSIAGARRGAILAGIGARTAGVEDLVYRLAYRLRLPVLTDVEGKGTIPEDDPLSLGLVGVGQSPAAGRYLAGGVDVLLTIGARLDDTSTSGFSGTLRPTHKLVQLDHDSRRLHRAFKADVAIAADLRVTLRALLETVLAVPHDPLVRFERDRATSQAKHVPSEVTPPLGVAPFDPRSVVVALQQAFGDEAVFTSDIGNHLLFAARHLVGRRGNFHVANGLGSMGSGIGTAMGMAAAWRGQRRVVGICGDGGLLMVGNELATCARYGVPVVLAVFDNQQLGMVEHGMLRLYGRSAYGESAHTDIVGFAQALGAEAVTLRSEEHLWDLASRPVHGPLVLHVPIDPNVMAGNPREHGFAATGSDDVAG